MDDCIQEAMLRCMQVPSIIVTGHIVTDFMNNIKTNL